ncbi:MAG: RNA 2',3'-cyclic phosphodiesterase [Halothiobacillaceae bacterium]
MAARDVGLGPLDAGVLGAPSHPRKRRLFFALWPDETTRRRLAAFLKVLPRGKGRDMRAENLHLTLAFLGDCEEGLLTCLAEVGSSLTGQPFELTFDRLGHFQRARVLWLGLSRPPVELFELQAHLADLLASRCGVPRAERPFAPTSPSGAMLLIPVLGLRVAPPYLGR